jgi:hypothetical protein
MLLALEGWLDGVPKKAQPGNAADRYEQENPAIPLINEKAKEKEQ